MNKIRQTIFRPDVFHPYRTMYRLKLAIRNILYKQRIDIKDIIIVKFYRTEKDLYVHYKLLSKLDNNVYFIPNPNYNEGNS